MSVPRRPVAGTGGMVATSQVRATEAGVAMLRRGGSAADAAVAAAAVLCVTEPMSTGIGGDCFALVWRDGDVHALDAAGPAPERADPGAAVAPDGPTSVTVPGAVGGWGALLARHGRFELDVCLADAIDAAEQGVAAAPMCSHYWRTARRAPAELGPPPAEGERYRLPDLGRSLRSIAQDGPDALYRGEIARAICAASWLDEADLAAYAPAWVTPLRLAYRGVEVVEMPPPTQGVVALEGLGLLEAVSPSLASRVAAVSLALEDGLARVRDGADVTELLTAEYLRRRRTEIAPEVREPGGGTVYLCAVDADGMAVSLIQSLYEGFGSGVVAPGTGIALQNRGACFAVAGSVTPGRRPYHTIIPGLLLRDGGLWGPFGIMGGFIQAQAHVQFVSAMLDDGLDPQAALDAPRFRVEGRSVHLEEGLWHRADEIAMTGLTAIADDDVTRFGGGQAILVDGDVRTGGSDRRKDGVAMATDG